MDRRSGGTKLESEKKEYTRRQDRRGEEGSEEGKKRGAERSGAERMRAKARVQIHSSPPLFSDGFSTFTAAASHLLTSALSLPTSAEFRHESLKSFSEMYLFVPRV